MSRHIGIVACSAEGAALCYRTICVEGTAILGPHNHPEITMHTHPLAAYMPGIVSGDWDDVAVLMLNSAEKLAGAGAEFLICPDNTIHQAFERVAVRSPLPWLHIAGEVAAEASRLGFKRLGILGTRYLMEGPVYPEQLSALGIEWLTPEAAVRARIDSIIFDELVYGRIVPESRELFVETISRLRDGGCDAVVLGCTEIPLIVTPDVSPLPTLDSTRLLARAALRRSVETASPSDSR